MLGEQRAVLMMRVGAYVISKFVFFPFSDLKGQKVLACVQGTLGSSPRSGDHSRRRAPNRPQQESPRKSMLFRPAFSRELILCFVTHLQSLH